MSRTLRALLVGFALLSAPLAHAEGDAAKPVESAKAADIRKLLVMTGAAQVGTQVMAQMMASMKQAMPNVPERFWNDFQKEVKPEELQALIVPIYDKHLSQEDIKALIKFYETPTGKRFIAEMPAITQESIAAGQGWGQALAQRVVDKLKREDAAAHKK